VASTAAFQPGPFMSVYYATKAFVLSFSEALAAELENTGVMVSCLCPGPTKTGFQAAAGLGSSKLFEKLSVGDSMSVAEMGVEGLKKNQPVVVAGLQNWIMAQSTRFAPRSTVVWLMKKLQGPRMMKQ
jgi:short-subunit dehydrogenase